MAEKAFLKGAGSIAKGGDGTLPTGALDCSMLCDVVGCLVICPDFKAMQEVVQELKDRPDLILCQVKSRWDSSSKGGWRDLICIVSIGPQRIMCEIQVVHSKMLVAREGLDGHKGYEMFRNFSEMLNFAGY